MANLKFSLNKIDDSVVINQIIAKLNEGLKLPNIKLSMIHFSNESKDETESTQYIGRQQIETREQNTINEIPQADFIAVVVDKNEFNAEFIGFIEQVKNHGTPYCLVFTDAAHKETFLSLKRLDESKMLIVKTHDKSTSAILKTIDDKISMIDGMLANKLHSTKTLYNILDKQINHNILNLKAKHILNKGEFIEMQFNDIRKLNKYSTSLRSTIGAEISHIGNQVKANSSKFLNENNTGKGKVSEEIRTYIGFQEEESSKQQTIRISEGFIDSIVEKTQSNVKSNIDKEIQFIKTAVNKLGLKINQELLDINVEPIKEVPAINVQKEEIFNSVLKPKNNIEKTVPKKGLYSLFMDLRTPIFMLMPLIMLWGILGALLIKPDVGAIDENILLKNGKDVIVITMLPEFLGSDFPQASKKFEKELNKRLNAGDFLVHGVEAVMFTQGKNGKEARLFIDEENKEISLYLNSDRSDVTAKLMEPSLNLLKKKTSVSGGGGFGKIAQALAGLPNPRLIFFLLMLLIAVYVRNKYKSFNSEKVHLVEKEKIGLLQSLQTEIHKYRNSIFGSWKNISDTTLKGVQDILTRDVETNISVKVEDETFKLKEKKSLYEKRSQNFKEKEKKLKETLMGIGKMQKELELFQKEIS